MHLKLIDVSLKSDKNTKKNQLKEHLKARKIKNCHLRSKEYIWDVNMQKHRWTVYNTEREQYDSNLLDAYIWCSSGPIS